VSIKCIINQKLDIMLGLIRKIKSPYTSMDFDWIIQVPYQYIFVFAVSCAYIQL